MNIAPSVGLKNLESIVNDAGGPVKLLRGSNIGPYTFPVIPPEFTNWRDEVRSWKDSVALLELSYHMTELHLRGPDAVKFLSTLATNKFDSFPVLRGKQLVLAGHDGYMIGDAIVFREEEEFLRIVGAPFASDWVQYNAEISGMNVTAVRDDNFSIRSGTRDVFRIQIQGPNALPLVREVSDGTLPDIKFFNIGEFQIAGHAVRALRHGMAGEPGYEIYGPWDIQHEIRAAFAEVGQKYGMRNIGAMAYSTTAQESGWMPMPLPAIYHSAEMKPYREWLNQYFLESVASLGGSFLSDKIEDYYVDPVEVGYKSLIDFNHDFIGKEALRERVANPKRKKVTLEWNNDDVMACMNSSLIDPDNGGMFMKLPNPMYATFQSDAIMKGGKRVGISQWLAYSANANRVISLSLVDIEHAEPGTEVTVLWGEPNSQRLPVGTHQLREIRAKVAPAPYFEKVIKTGQQ
ncbi:glycine cleavage system aminomethyltransferase T [Rhizobium sp. BK226]|uniref:aminomethyltransferase family protein n=1 Tax=Rhizobium TaxID=379 RepID=UPI000BE958B5|nr:MULTISPECIES: aminomethyltransferase family protein [Rhizobium]MBB4116110.1 glycine cleavage system aminomethyltransferase T [Rhizobium sp. BK226]PDS54361.1 aminomethyltransferase [Rhizobium anhuiense]PDS61453.1 aminomethyltransferase [Rhizobium anhuiense]